MNGITEEEIEKENEEWKCYIFSNMSDNQDEVDEGRVSTETNSNELP